MRFLEKISTHTPLSEKSQTSRWLVLHWRLQSSVQIRVLGCSVTFLSNYHEVPLGFEVSLRSGYSNEMECTMVSWWSLRSLLKGTDCPKYSQTRFGRCSSKTQCTRSWWPHRTAGGERHQQQIHLLWFASITPPYFTWQLNPSLLLLFLPPFVPPCPRTHSALVSPCLNITSPERNVNRIRPIPTQLPLNSSFSAPLLCCRATWSFPCTRHNLRLRFWRLTVRLRRSAVSGVGCSMWSRSQASGKVRPEGLLV